MAYSPIPLMLWISFLLNNITADDVTEYGMAVKLRHLSSTDHPQDYEAECSVIEKDTTYVIDFIKDHQNGKYVMQGTTCKRTYLGLHTFLTCKINIKSSELYDGSRRKCELKDDKGNQISYFEIGDV